MPVRTGPSHVAAERLGQHGERCEQCDLREGRRKDVRRRDRQHDSLRRGDDLAPVARRQVLAHPRQQPPGCEERIARRADREHPRAGRARDEHAEHQDQERVDLAVELRAERRPFPRASHDLAVDAVEHEGNRRKRHEQRDLRGPAERVRGQRGDGDGERCPRERHPVGRPQPAGTIAGEAEHKHPVHDHSAGDPDDPTGAAEARGRRNAGDQRHLRDQPDQRAGLNRSQPSCGYRPGLNRSHRSSVFAGTSGTTGDKAVRISGAGAGVRVDRR
jgi:hypothetical protein